MRGYRSQYPSLEVASHAGPLALIDGTPTLDDITLAARIVGRYSQGREAPSIELAYRSPEGIVTPLRVRPQGVDEMPEVWLI